MLQGAPLQRRRVLASALVIIVVLFAWSSVPRARSAAVLDAAALVLPSAAIPPNVQSSLSRVEDNVTLDQDIAADQAADSSVGLDWVHPAGGASPDAFGRINGYLETGWWTGTSTSTPLAFHYHFSYLASIFADPEHATAFYNDNLRLPGGSDISGEFSTIGDQRYAEVLQVPGPVPFTRASIDFTRSNVEVEIGMNTPAGLSPDDVNVLVGWMRVMASAADALILYQAAPATAPPATATTAPATATSVPTATATATATASAVPTTPTCSDGYVLVGTSCEKSASTGGSCYTTYVLLHGGCSVPAKRRCKKGQHLVNGHCRSAHVSHRQARS